MASAAMEELMAKVAYEIHKETVLRCPVDTGRMVQSISVQKTSEGYTVTVGVDYSAHIEYGSAAMVAAHGEHDPMNPVTDWAAKRAHGSTKDSTMPFLRPAIYYVFKKMEQGDL